MLQSGLIAIKATRNRQAINDVPKIPWFLSGKWKNVYDSLVFEYLC